MKALVVLLCLLCFPANASPSDNSITYKISGEQFEGYYVSPAPDAPLVVLVHDWDGLTGYEVKRAEMLTEFGYAVFAADLYGKGIRPVELADKRSRTEALYQDRSRMRVLLNGALKAAKEQEGNVEKAVAMGYCFGGTAILEWARSGVDLKGFVSFHGGLTTPENQDYSNTKAGLLILHGTADSSVSMADFADLAVQLEMAGVPHEMITYGGAPHAFTVFGSDRYRKDADEKSWKRFTEFLAETLN